MAGERHATREILLLEHFNVISLNCNQHRLAGVKLQRQNPLHHPLLVSLSVMSTVTFPLSFPPG